ncbi:type II toxin-antitoxin system RelB family antitoxin [Candidatus Enterococcus mangumiae]|nr:DUF6290 family protein [Enterococcus sp. DIV1094]MBO0488912.1 antitoxin [Enterococcus sp. DIV1094]
MAQSIITFRIPDDEKELVVEYAKAHNLSLTKLYRTAVLEKIEEQIELELLNDAIILSKEKEEEGISQIDMEQLLEGVYI